MDLENYNYQSHVAQQSRRNKLRDQQTTQHIEDYPGNLNQLNSNLAQIPNDRMVNLSYEPSLVSSEMQNLTANKSLLLSTHKNTHRGPDDRQSCVPWRSCNWVDNYLGDQNLTTVGEGSVSVTKAYDPPSSLYKGPSFDGYQCVNGADYTNPSSKLQSQNSQKMYEDMHYNPSQVYQNVLPLVMVSTLGTMRAERLGPSSIIDQTNTHHWCRNLNSTITSDSIKQGLSLSLSQDGLVYPNGNLTSNYTTSTSKQSVVASSNKNLGNTGPLGPFTGYATILKNSKFLGPAQQLLGDVCIINASTLAHTSEALKSKISNEANGFGNAVNFIDQSSLSSPRVSSPRFNGSNESSGEVLWTKAVEIFRPEYQQKKEKLLFLQEEVSRRHKQYYQQMEMVVSSFESVSGLSAATPYIPLAVKAVSGNFRSLKDVISEQLKNICKTLGDASTSSKGYTSSPRLSFTDQEKLMKHKIDRDNLGNSHSHQPHTWRPQRGLPERAVSVLRAWLFEHFLHPYPTDTDKHMLASQTGLTRDQVSNWFINARVRVWKPMVEEIHALETKSTGMEISNSNQDGITTNLPDKPSSVFATSSNKVAGRVSYGDQWDHAIEKRLRTDYQTPDTSFMGFTPYQRSGLGIDIGGHGPVSLTLGLRQSPEEMGSQQQEQEHEMQHFGGQMVHHDFVG